jgi:hypothetical protein
MLVGGMRAVGSHESSYISQLLSLSAGLSLNFTTNDEAQNAPFRLKVYTSLANKQASEWSSSCGYHRWQS